MTDVDRIAVFDLETTGVDPETARIVTASFGYLDASGATQDGFQILVNPGVEIPPAATAVHGISTAKAVQDGISPLIALDRICGAMQEARGRDVPLVIFNAPYDLTVLDREIRRHEVGIVGDIGGASGIWWDAKVNAAADILRRGGEL